MSSFERILYPVDFSEPGHPMASAVREMVQHQHASLTLLHVIQPFPMSYAEGFTAVPLDYISIRRRCEEDLKALVEREFAGLNVECVVEEGDAASLINGYAQRNNIDLIMMQTHGCGRFRQFLLGSVTAKVLHDAECPVWTTAHVEQAAARTSGPVHRIAAAVDQTDRSLPVLQWAGKLAKESGARVTAIHVLPDTSGLPDKYFDIDLLHELSDSARKEIQKQLDILEMHVPICVGKGDIPDTVCTAAHNHNADLLVIGRGHLHDRFGRLRTNTYGIIRRSMCPVLSV